MYVNTSRILTNGCKALTKDTQHRRQPRGAGTLSALYWVRGCWWWRLPLHLLFTVTMRSPYFLWDTSNICAFDLSKATSKLFKSKMIQDKGPGPCNTTTPHHIMHPLRKHLAHGCLLTLPCVILPHKSLWANLGGLFRKPNKLLCVCNF